ncbi:MAG: nitroreductase family protein [Clostridiales bacterium]|nr:nitroreductase family protein [Clostridiales bacterium]
MDIFKAIYSRRTIRKFRPVPVSRNILYKLIDCARLAPSAANRQPIKYAVIDGEELNSAVFPLTKWAGYKPEAGPLSHERPPAYIAVLGDDSISRGTQENDAGLAMSAICLAATGEGLGSCILGAIDRDRIGSILNLPKNLHLLYLIAIGYPAQESTSAEMKDGDCKYYLENGRVYVPKRPLEDIIINYQEKKS